MNTADVLFKKKSFKGSVLFCKKELNCIKAKKIVLSLSYYIWEKNYRIYTGMENMSKTRKTSTKNHVDSCYYAMLLERDVQLFIS